MRYPIVAPIVAGAAASVLALTGSGIAIAQSAKPVPIRFARGTTGASVKGTIRGYADATYTLGVRAGQIATFTLTSTSPSLYFNILTPSGVSMVADDNDWHNPLPESGTYRIIVYLHRNAARPGVNAPYTLSVSVK